MYPLRPPQYPPAIPPPPRRPRYFDEVDTATGTSEADAFEVEPLDQIFFNPIITNGINNGEEGEVDILVYQEQERAIYLKGFQASTARSYTYIEDFEPIEDEIIVGGILYMIEIDDEIIAGESSNDVDHFRIMGNTAIDFEDFRGGGNHDFEDQILPIDFRLV